MADIFDTIVQEPVDIFDEVGRDFDVINFVAKEKPIGFKESFKREWTDNFTSKLPFIGTTLDMIPIITASQRLSKPDYDYFGLNENRRRIQLEGLPPEKRDEIGLEIPYSKVRDQELVNKYISKIQEEQRRGYTWSGRVVQGVSRMPTWMIEFALTGGLANVAGQPVKEAGKKLLGKTAETFVGKAVIKTAELSARAAMRTSVAFLPKVGTMAAERQIQQQAGIKPEEGWATSLAKSWGDTFVESFSEETGQYISSGLVWGVGKLPFGSRFVSGLQKMWSKVSGGNAAEFFKKIATAGGYSDIIGEIGEERLGSLMKDISGVSDREGNIVERVISGIQEDYTISNLTSEAAVLSIPMGGQVALSRLNNIYDKITRTKQVIRGEIPDITVTSEIKDVINESTDLTDDQKDIGLKYIGDIETRIITEVVDKFPDPITDQESLEQVGNAIKESLGITQDVKWVWNNRRTTGSAAYYEGGKIVFKGGNKRLTASSAGFYVSRGIWKDVPNKTPGQINQDFVKMVLVHEIGHLETVKPSISTRRLRSFPGTAIITEKPNVENPGKNYYEITYRGETVGDKFADSIEQAQERFITDYNNRRPSKRQVHHPEFMKWVNEGVKKLTEVREKKVPVERPETMGPIGPKQGEVKPVVPEVKPSAAKQPYEMTGQEYVKSGNAVKLRKGNYYDTTQSLYGNTGKTLVELHKNLIKLAIENGKTIPSEVLAEYPELGREVKEEVETGKTESTVGGEVKEEFREGAPKGLRRRQALIMGHEIPAMLNWTEEQCQAFNKQTTGKESMKDMTLEEVRKVAETLQGEAEKVGIKYEIPKISEIKDIVDSLVSTISTLGKRKVKKTETPYTLYPGRIRKILRSMKKGLGGLLDYGDKPEKILEEFDGGKPMSGPFYNTFVKPLNDASDTSVNNNTTTRENLIKFMQDTVGKHELDDFLFTPKLVMGTDIKLTDVDRIGIGMADIDMAMMRHLTDGNNFTLEQIKAIKNSITEKDRTAWGHTNDWFISHQTPLLLALSKVEKIGGKIRVSVEQLRKQFMKNYFGLVLKDTSTDAQPDFFDVLAQPFEGTKITPSNRDIIAKRTGSDAPIETNFIKVFLYKSARVERFIQTAPLAAKLAKIMGAKKLRAEINHRTWSKGVKLVENYVADALRGSRSFDMEEVDSKLEYMRQAGAAYAIKDNVLSVLRQSFLGGFNTLQRTPRLIPYAIKNAILYPRFVRLNALREFVYSHSSQMKARENLPFTKLKTGDKALLNLLKGKSPIQRGYRVINMADEDAALHAWKWVFDLAMHDTKGNEMEAIKQADYDSRTRQSNPSPQNLPAVFRSKSIGARMLVTFNTEMAPLFNIYKNEIIRAKARGEIGWGITGYRIIMSHVLPATLMGIISRGRLPRNWKEIGRDLIYYLISPTLFLGNFVQQAITGVRTGMIAFAGWDALIAFLQSTPRLKNWSTLTSKEKDILLRSLVKNAAKTIGGFTGLIAAQHVRSIEGLFDLITKKTDDWRRLIWSEPALQEPEEKNKYRR